MWHDDLKFRSHPNQVTTDRLSRKCGPVAFFPSTSVEPTAFCQTINKRYVQKEIKSIKISIASGKDDANPIVQHKQWLFPRKLGHKC